MAESNARDNHKTDQQILENNDEDENDECATFLQSPPTSALPVNMATEEPKRKKYQKVNGNGNSGVFQHMTTAAHACVLLYVILIIYYCFSGNFDFFTWHPLLLSIGWMFLMTEAILSISTENLFTGTLSKGIRVRLHWVFQAIALILIIIGFIVVYLNKNYLSKEHFKSWHGLFGFIGIIGAIFTFLNGIPALYHGALRHYIRVKLNKFIHIASGIIAFGFGGMALMLSVYTKWFARHSNESVIIFTLGLGFVTVAVVWTLVRPVITSSGHLRHLLN